MWCGLQNLKTSFIDMLNQEDFMEIIDINKLNELEGKENKWKFLDIPTPSSKDNNILNYYSIVETGLIYVSKFKKKKKKHKTHRPEIYTKKVKFESQT